MSGVKFMSTQKYNLCNFCNTLYVTACTLYDDTFNFFQDEESSVVVGGGAQEFRDSTAFLKGTQSMNPHNDYSQNFVDTGPRRRSG
jgi:hypothetical protein